MGKMKELWAEGKTEVPTWYQYHERELDQMVSNVIIYNVSYLISALYITLMYKGLVTKTCLS